MAAYRVRGKLHRVGGAAAGCLQAVGVVCNNACGAELRRAHQGEQAERYKPSKHPSAPPPALGGLPAWSRLAAIRVGRANVCGGGLAGLASLARLARCAQKNECVLGGARLRKRPLAAAPCRRPRRAGRRPGACRPVHAQAGGAGARPPVKRRKSAGERARVSAAKRTTPPRACLAYTAGPGKARVKTGAPRAPRSMALEYSSEAQSTTKRLSSGCPSSSLQASGTVGVCRRRRNKRQRAGRAAHLASD